MACSRSSSSPSSVSSRLLRSILSATAFTISVRLVMQSSYHTSNILSTPPLTGASRPCYSVDDMKYRRTNHHDYSRWLTEHQDDVNWLYDHIFVPDPDGEYEVVSATCTHDNRRLYVSTFWPDEGPCCSSCIHRRHPGTLGFAESASHTVYWTEMQNGEETNQ